MTARAEPLDVVERPAGAALLADGERTGSAAKISRAAARFIRSQRARIVGWLGPTDAKVISRILEQQADLKLKGNLCEIGVYHGRLGLLLALFRRPAEHVYLVDIDHQQQLTINADVMGLSLSGDEIWQVDSTKLDALVFSNRVGSVRFASVDGGHDYSSVLHDLRILSSVMCEGGIIAVDDFFNQCWPEVTAAGVDWLRGNEANFKPILLTREKLYVCKTSVNVDTPYDMRSIYFDLIEEAVELFGTSLPYCKDSIAIRMLDWAAEGILAFWPLSGVKGPGGRRRSHRRNSWRISDLVPPS